MHKILTIPAEFAINSAKEPSPSMIPYIGKIFEIGDYPDREFSLSEAEADAAVAAFTPVENDYEHHHGLLDGKLGTLTRVWREGGNLMGEMLVPRQVRELAGATLRTSLTWARESKQIIGNALTATPRISDAMLIAAFSGLDHGFDGLMDSTDVHAPDGATTNRKEHTMTLKDRFLALFSGGKMPEELSEEELALFACTSGTGTSGTGVPPVKDPDLHGRDGHATASTGTSGTGVPPVKDPDLHGQDGHATVRPAEDPAIAGIKQRQLLGEAEALFSGALAQGKLLPAQHDCFLTLFTCLHKGDNGGAVTFTLDGALSEGDGQQALKAFLAALPDNPALFTERLQTEAAQGNILMFASGDTTQPSAARMAALKGYAGISK